jgi:serine/threonine protein kinase
MTRLRRIEHEYGLRAALESDWAARPVSLANRNGRAALVLEDPGGELLDRLLRRPMDLTEFLRIAVSLAVALQKTHGRGLIHKDVRPANVLVDMASATVWLTGFGIASRLPREHQVPELPEVIVGTLAYMAPEQTGRMNRSIDSRSDLYALGVSYYEMLTGVLPFAASDGNAPAKLIKLGLGCVESEGADRGIFGRLARSGRRGDNDCVSVGGCQGHILSVISPLRVQT